MASQVVEEGRGLVLVLNKMDLIPADKRAGFLQTVRQMAREQLAQIPGVPLIATSALNGKLIVVGIIH